jgi:hypothetical protein
MDIAMRQEAGPRRPVANATQLYKVRSTRGPATRGFLDWSRSLSKGINVSRAAAFSLGAALVFVFGGPLRATDSIGQVPLQAPPSVAVPFDWTEPMSAATSDTAGETGATRCSI